jgi:hypothetical protein
MENTLQIKVKKKITYGNDFYYPVCETAKKFALLIKRKSFTKRYLEIIKSMGYEIKLEEERLEI